MNVNMVELKFANIFVSHKVWEIKDYDEFEKYYKEFDTDFDGVWQYCNNLTGDDKLYALDAYEELTVAFDCINDVIAYFMQSNEITVRKCRTTKRYFRDFDSKGKKRWYVEVIYNGKTTPAKFAFKTTKDLIGYLANSEWEII